MSFKNLNLNSKSLYLVDKLGFKIPTEIQEKVIPKVLKKRNIIAQAPTGSGKTHSFLLPLLQMIEENKGIQTLIVLPTRELAYQIDEELKLIKGDIKSTLLVGGTDKNKSLQSLKKSNIIIGTPGRIIEVMKESKSLFLTLQNIVYDEADMLFDLGYDDELNELFTFLPKELQTLLFSATFSIELQNTFAKFLVNPEIFILQKKSFNKLSIKNYLLNDKISKKNETLLKLIKHINPYVCLIFCSRRDEVDTLYDILLSNDIEGVVKLHSKLEPRKRKKVLMDIRDNKFTYIIASDIAARGIDITGVTQVINYSLSDEKYFIHRIGRTGRADKTGESYTFYNVELEETIKKYEKKGLEFKLVKFDQENNLIDAGDRQKRVRRNNFDQKIDEEAWNKVRKAKKVKPGYKVKMKKEKDRIKRKMKRDYFKEEAKRQRLANKKKGSKF